MKEYFLSCTALKMYSFLADHQKDAFKIASLSLKRLDASACSRLSIVILIFTDFFCAVSTYIIILKKILFYMSLFYNYHINDLLCCSKLI